MVFKLEPKDELALGRQSREAEEREAARDGMGKECLRCKSRGKLASSGGEH